MLGTTLGGHAGYVENSHIIKGSIGAGIYIDSNASVVNSGYIYGKQTGVQINNTAAAYIKNSGTMLAGQNYGLALHGGGDINNTGLLEGPTGGVNLYPASTVHNSGIIKQLGSGVGTNNSYAGLNMQHGGNVYNSLSGTITGLEGIHLQGSAASYIDNAGKITGTKTEGIVSDTALTIKNTGTISGVYNGITSYNPGGASTINNYGLIVGTGTTFISGTTTYNANGIALTAGGTITNHALGQIKGNLGIYLSGGGGNVPIYLDNLGSITGTASNGVVFGTSGKLSNAGNITGATDGVEFLGGGKLVNAGTVTGQGGIAVNFKGSAGSASQLGVDPGAVFNGIVEVNGGTGTLKLASASSAGTISGIGSQFTGFGTIDIQTGASWQVEGSVSGLASGQAIAGFANTDTIILDGFTATSESYVAGTGLELSNGVSMETIGILGALNSGNFLISSNTSGTVIKEVTCYAQGTRIATMRGEVAVEDLQIGDAVQTMHAGQQRIKWIGVRRYGAPFANHAKVLPIHIKAGALAENIPSRDLFVSPGHAICIDGALVHAMRLVNGVSIMQLPRVEEVTYFHIELENHEVIFAENCPAETFMGEYFRPQFHNAESFQALYPQDSAPEHMCLPRLDSGFQLDAIRHRLNQRAGIAGKQASAIGSLRGYIDQLTAQTVSGWAQDVSCPETPVCLDIYCDDCRIGRVPANIYREDVRDAGYGSGSHGFEFAIPPEAVGTIVVRRSADQAALMPTNEAMTDAA